MSTSSSSSESSDDDINNIIYILPRPRILRVRNNPLDMYDDIDFKMRFRLNKETVLSILDVVGQDLGHGSQRNAPVSEINQLCLALRYYATGCFQLTLGDIMGVNKSTICRIIPKVTHALARLAPQFIKMPATIEELQKTQSDFYGICGFPCISGCIDCTHVRIQSPGRNTGELYRNRKGWFSINVQAICDAHLKITNIIARWAGSVHDSTIFNNSAIHADLMAGNYNHTYLLGDSGYACKSYLLTPLLNPRTAAENRYNTAHIETRTTIDRTFGILKKRFPCLSVGMSIKLNKILAVIVATAVVHNIAILTRDEEPPKDPNVFVPPNALEPVPVDLIADENRNNNFAVRTALINTVFSRER